MPKVTHSPQYYANEILAMIREFMPGATAAQLFSERFLSEPPSNIGYDVFSQAEGKSERMFRLSYQRTAYTMHGAPYTEKNIKADFTGLHLSVHRKWFDMVSQFAEAYEKKTRQQVEIEIAS